MVDSAEGVPQEEYGEADEDDLGEYTRGEFAEGDNREFVNCIVHRVLLAPKLKEPTQQHNIFKTCCTINEKVCNLIIDNGSWENIVSKRLVATLQLKTEKHLNPYKINWIKKGVKTTVTDTCQMPFSIG